MSTIKRDSDVSNLDWIISNKAVDMLQCFMSGIDDVVIRIALEEKKKKVRGSVVRIESEDIEYAAKLVMSHIRSQNIQQGISVSEIDTMEECLKAKRGDTT